MDLTSRERGVLLASLSELRSFLQGIGMDWDEEQQALFAKIAEEVTIDADR